MSFTKEYRKVKIDSRGRVLLPEELREYLQEEKVTHVNIIKVVDDNGTRHEIRWKRPKKSHVEKAREFVGKY